MGMLRQVIQCKQKKWRWPTQDPHLANSTNETVRCSLTLKKKKKKIIVFKIRKEYLRIIFFLVAIKDLCFKQVHKYARLRKQLDNFRVHI